MKKTSLKLLAASLAFAALPSYAFSVSVTPASGWGASDAALGVDGFVIEDFEDVALASGLQVQLRNAFTVSDNYGPTASLPALFDPASDDASALKLFVAGIWDGSHVLLNHYPRNLGSSYDPVSGFGNWADITFHFNPGATSVGFSLEQLETSNNQLLVNGTLLVPNVRALLGVQNLPNGFAGRNGYLRIDAAPGEAILSVTLNNGGGDGFAFDHLAFAPIPEPSAYVLMLGGLGALGCVLARRRRNRY